MAENITTSVPPAGAPQQPAGNASVTGNNVTGVSLTSSQPAMNKPAPSQSADKGTTFVSANPMSSFYMPDGRLIVFGSKGEYVTNDEEEIEELSKACLSSHGAIRKV